MARLPDAEMRATAAAFAAGTLIAQQVASKAVRDALFLSNFDVRSLPTMMMVGAVASLGAVALMSWILPSRGPSRVVPAALALSAALLIGEWALSVTSLRTAAVVVYLHLALFNAPLLSAFWSLVNESFDPHSARKVMGRIGTGASVGGVLGGALSWASAGWLPVPALLLVLAGSNVAALLLTRSLAGGGVASTPPGPAPVPPATGPLAAFAVLRQNPHLSNLALFVAAGAVMEALLDYAMSAVAAAQFTQAEELVGFFSLFHTTVAIIALVAQSTLATRSLEGLGLAGTVALQPAVAAVTGVLAMLVPRLFTVALARASEAVIHNSLYRSAYELLFTPLPEVAKRLSKSAVDVGADKLGSILGAGAAGVLVAALPTAGPQAALGLAALLGVAALFFARRLHLGYVEALAESLRSGAVRLSVPDVHDSTTRLTLATTTATIERETLLRQLRELGHEPARGGDHAEGSILAMIRDLTHEDPRVARRALLRADLKDPRLASHALLLLERDTLLLEALRTLRRAAPHMTGLLIDALLDPGHSTELRRRVARVLKGCPTERAAEGLVRGLSDASFEVRHEAGRALARITEGRPDLRVAEPSVFEAVRLELGSWPKGKDERSERLAHVFTLLGLVFEREPLRIAYWSLISEHPLKGTALEYLENVLPRELQAPLWTAFGMEAPTSGRSLADIRDALLRLRDAPGLDRRPGRRPL